MTTDDEKAIRQVMETWMSATKAGDAETVLGLMSEDAVFLTPGAEPFGKEAFAAAAEGRSGMDIDATGDIQEIHVLGDWAFMRAHLTMTVRVGGNPPMRRSGYTLTILRRDPDGQWRLTRDANLVTPDE